MADAISIDAGGIKCDACDYKDETVPVSAYPSYIGRPCPACGANLLTEEDYAAHEAILASVRWINTLVGPVEAAPDAERGTLLTWEFSGDGMPLPRLTKPEVG